MAAILLWVASALCELPTATAADMVLRAGVAKRKVTPPIFVPYLTSSGNATSAPFQGVHDDLYARALVVEQDGTAIAIIAVDSIGYDNSLLGPGRNFTDELRKRVAAKTDLQPAAIMLSASHTHSAPETIGLTSFRETPGVPEWIEEHLSDLVATAVTAWEARVPVTLKSGTTHLKNFSRYRRIALKDGRLSRQGPLPEEEELAIPWELDQELVVLFFEHMNGRPHSVLMNYTAHPVIAMLLPEVSADYPGVATATVEAALPGAICLFTQGAAGNINSQQVATNFDDVQMAGTQMARAALDAIEHMGMNVPDENSTVQFASKVVTLQARDCPTVDEAQRTVDAEASSQNLRLLRLARRLEAEPQLAEVQAIRVGPATWIGLPGEPFVETGLALKHAGATFVVGYANGYLGYLPIRRAYLEGGYETTPGLWSRVAPGTAERLQQIGEELLEQLSADEN